MNDNRTCDNCHGPLSSDIRGIYCRKCLSTRKHDVCEIINTNGFTIYNKNNLAELQPLISQKEITLRLDLHGVLDTVDHTVIFDQSDTTCCISFVGNTTKTRVNAREEIMKRLGHQISYGVLVFSRGKNTHHKVGGKAWINNLIPLPINKKGLFIDDSEDHYESVKSLGIHNLDCLLYNKQHNNLYKLIGQNV